MHHFHFILLIARVESTAQTGKDFSILGQFQPINLALEHVDDLFLVEFLGARNRVFQLHLLVGSHHVDLLHESLLKVVVHALFDLTLTHSYSVDEHSLALDKDVLEFVVEVIDQLEVGFTVLFCPLLSPLPPVFQSKGTELLETHPDTDDHDLLEGVEINNISPLDILRVELLDQLFHVHF